MSKDDSSPAFDPTRPFTRAQAIAAGLSDADLRSRRFRRLPLGTHVLSHIPDSPLLAAQSALAAAEPGAWASHATAGRVHGVPLPALPGEHVTGRTKSRRPKRTGLSGHVTSVDAWIVTLEDTRVSSPAQLFIELAELLNLVDLVVVGDWLVRKEKVKLGHLLDRCHTSRHRGAPRARAAAAYVRERVDSPMETRLRMLIVLAGLPEPEVNLTIRDIDGEPVRRYDLCWPEARVIAEYDGRDHVQRIEQWEQDLSRREAIDDEGWRILVVIADGVYTHPEQTLERIHRLLRARRLPAVPRRLRDDWRPHFPGRA